MESPKVFEALVAAFDVLGAQAVFSKNTRDGVRIATATIFAAFKDATESLITEFSSAVKNSSDIEEQRSTISEMSANMSFKFYGDTMVALVNLDDTRPLYFNITCQMFIAQAQIIYYKMLECGFPVRGFLDYGYVGTSGSIITGRPYVAAIRNSDQLEFSGVAVSDAFLEKVSKLNCPEIYPLNIPTKQGRTNANILDWLDNTEFLEENRDIRQDLFFSFFRHGKRSDDSVLRKLNNTEDLIRMMRQHRVNVVDEQRPRIYLPMQKRPE